MSLRYRIALTVFVLEAIMVGLVLWQVLGVTFDRTAAQIEKTDQGLLGLLSGFGKTALLTREFEGLQIQFEQVSRDPHVAAILLLNPAGLIVASNESSMVGRPLFQDELPGVQYWLRREITSASGRIGNIVIKFSNAALLKSNSEARNAGLAVAGVSMTLIAVVGLLLGFAMSRRLENLAAVADQAATGDYSRDAKIAGRDEIARVGRSFDLMLDKTRASLTALEKSENSLADAQRIANIGNWEWDMESGRVRRSAEMYRILDMAPDELDTSRDSFLDRIHPDDRNAVDEEMDAIVDTGEPANLIFRIIRSDGTIRHLREVTEVRFDDYGKPSLIVGTTQDITSEIESRDNDARYRVLTTVAPIGIFHTDTQGLVTYVNEKWCEIGGMTSKKAIGAGWINAVHPDDRARTAAKWDSFIGNKSRFVNEYRYQRPDGVVAHCYIQALPEIDADGQLRGFIGCVTDITDRVQAEEALRKSEERFRTVVNFSPTKVHIKDLEGRYLLINKESEELFGVSDEDARGRTSAEIFPRERAEAFRVHDRAVIEAGRAIEMEEEWVRDDSVHTYLTVKFPIRDASGKTVAIGAIGTDITERKKVENELRFRGEIIENMAEGVIIARLSDGEIVFTNAKFDLIFGFDPGELVGNHISTINARSGEDPVKQAQYIFDTINAVGSWSGEIKSRRKDGSEFWCDASVSAFEHSEYGKTGISIYTDITKRKDTDEILRQAQKMEAVGQLTGGIAHDFNNLLAIILGNAQLLENILDDDNALDLLTPLIQSTRRGADLAHRLLAFSRQQPLNPQAIYIGELCMGMTELLHRALGEMIEIDVRIGVLSPAHADPGQLENTLLNLALNARDAMPRGGKLTIETENLTLTEADMNMHPNGRPGDYVVLKVSDSGIGMAPEILEKVFEPFFTTKEVGAGSGLGLSMVYGFAQQSGGHVTIESEVGHGTTVALYLPQAEAATEDDQRETVGQAMPRGQGETILVVEDEPALRRLTTKQLESLGYKTLQAPDGPVALAIFADPPAVDLLLSDVVLPGGMTGPEIYQQGKEQLPGLRCLFMSGYAVTPGATLPEGIDLLSKPFEIAELAGKLRAALAHDVAPRKAATMEQMTVQP